MQKKIILPQNEGVRGHKHIFFLRTGDAKTQGSLNEALFFRQDQQNPHCRHKACPQQEEAPHLRSGDESDEFCLYVEGIQDKKIHPSGKEYVSPLKKPVHQKKKHLPAPSYRGKILGLPGPLTLPP